MSRCRCCDTPLANNEGPGWNKLAHQEEDLCSVCRYLVYNSYSGKEYVGGRYPTEGLTGAANIKDS